MANARAIDAGEKEVRCRLDGGAVDWIQPSFKYQRKCVAWLQEEHAQLSPQGAKWVGEAVVGSGLAGLLVPGASSRL
jgi:hypothetical protein